MRRWDNLQNDEIYAIWKEYLITDGYRGIPLQLDSIERKPMRLTVNEIIKLVEELLNRLEIKSGENESDIANRY